MIEMNEDSLHIYDANGKEIVCWVEDEWTEDPSVAISMANAVHIFHTQGPEYLKTILNEV